MCLICIEMAKDSLRKQDFVNNYTELVISNPEHAEEVMDKWLDKQKDEPFDDLFELD